jgi:hypothetical protein
MEILFVGILVVFVLTAVSITGTLRVIRDASERTATATEALLDIARSERQSEY